MFHSQQLTNNIDLIFTTAHISVIQLSCHKTVVTMAFQIFFVPIFCDTLFKQRIYARSYELETIQHIKFLREYQATVETRLLHWTSSITNGTSLQSAYRRRHRIVRCHLQTAFEVLFVRTIVRHLMNCYICCYLSLKLRFTAG